jgi:cytochrome c biogenesis protein CcmG/thiol:disulfide interchange protein DsbE
MIAGRNVVRAVSVALVAAALACVAGCDQPPLPKATYDFVLKDPNGRDVNFAEFKGKPMVVNFWATWCAPCKIETPYLEAFARKYKDKGLTIVGVETYANEPELIRQFASAYKVTYPLVVGFDREDLWRVFGYRGTLPTSAFVRADGTITAVVIGLRSEEYWERQILSLF